MSEDLIAIFKITDEDLEFHRQVRISDLIFEGEADEDLYLWDALCELWDEHGMRWVTDRLDTNLNALCYERARRNADQDNFEMDLIERQEVET